MTTKKRSPKRTSFVCMLLLESGTYQKSNDPIGNMLEDPKRKRRHLFVISWAAGSFFFIHDEGRSIARTRSFYSWRICFHLANCSLENPPFDTFFDLICMRTSHLACCGYGTISELQIKNKTIRSLEKFHTRYSHYFSPEPRQAKREALASRILHPILTDRSDPFHPRFSHLKMVVEDPLRKRRLAETRSLEFSSR